MLTLSLKASEELEKVSNNKRLPLDSDAILS